MSVVRNIGSRTDDIRLHFIASPPFVETSRAVMPDTVPVIEWPHALRAPVTSIVQSETWAKLRSRLGPLQPAFDYGVWFRRAIAVSKAIAKAEDCDAILAKSGIEVVHFGWPMTFATRLPFIYEPHDLQHRHYPDFFPKEVLRWRESVYGPGCRNAAFVVCGTWWTKHDIMRQYGVPSERVAVIPRSSVNARSAVEPEREQEIVAAHALDRPFALYPAMTFMHKNHMRLIAAVRQLRDSGGPRIRIICTGRKIQPAWGDIQKAITETKLDDQVQFLGTVPDDTLTILYKRAAYLVFPSLFEGHSQSLLEGLHQGLPVVAAQQSSIPETVGKAGLYFDGQSTEAIALALAEAHMRPDFLGRLRKATAGETARYEWSDAAETFVAVYRKAAGRELTSAQSERLAVAIRRDQ